MPEEPKPAPFSIPAKDVSEPIAQKYFRAGKYLLPYRCADEIPGYEPEELDDNAE